MIFRDRLHAAELLAEQLGSTVAAQSGSRPLVLAIPRGAVPMARVIADRLNADLDVVLVHKIPAPGQPELAIGSVGLSGHGYRFPGVEQWNISADYLKQEIPRQVKLLKQRRQDYGLPETPADMVGRTVIIVDDGIATGSTMMGAIHEVRLRHPARLIVAAAVASREAVAMLKTGVDDLVILHTPAVFMSVGHFFEDFSQVTDQEAMALLKAARGTTHPPSRARGEPSL
ncbi:MAG: hypothetical protein RLZZ385_1266 [Pseudomonadota bacterium]|jgi:predicted phosphoribosyltransferase